MRDLVDGKEQILVRSRSEDVGDSPELPGPERSRLKVPSPEDLHGDDAEDNPFGQRLWATELGDLRRIMLEEPIGSSEGAMYLGVSLDNGETSCTMRLLGIGPEEVLGAIFLLVALGSLCGGS